jgi:hypothetical protein
MAIWHPYYGHRNHTVGSLEACLMVWCMAVSLPQTYYRQLHYNHQSYTATTGGILPLPPAQHSPQQFTHITNTHILCESVPLFQTHHRQLHCNHQSHTATTGATQPPLVQHSHHWWNIPIAASTAQPPAIYAQTHSLPIHSEHPSDSIHTHNAWQIILLSTQPLPAHHSNCRQHSHWCRSNAATSAGAAPPPLATCTYLFEQHLHGLHPCLQHFGDSHHCNASTSGATQPPPELRSHHWCYAVTTGVAQPPPVIPILSFLLSLWHFQYTTNSCHCNPTTSGAAQPPVISPLPFHHHPRCSQLI